MNCAWLFLVLVGNSTRFQILRSYTLLSHLFIYVLLMAKNLSSFMFCTAHTALGYVWQTVDRHCSHQSRPTMISNLSSYCIAGNFQGRRLLWFSEKYNFHGETFADCSLSPCLRTPCPNFIEKTFMYSHKTGKFVTIFSWESFPLYIRCSTQRRHPEE